MKELVDSNEIPDDTSIYDLVGLGLTNKPNLLKILHHLLGKYQTEKDLNINDLKTTSITKFLKQKEADIPADTNEYNKLLNNKYSKKGGKNNKYIINTNIKTKEAYILYNNRKKYLHKDDNNNLFIKMDKKIIYITKKIIRYDNKSIILTI